MLASNDYDFFIQWHLTERCNLRCRHCYQRGISSGAAELSHDEAMGLIDEVSEMLGAWSDRYGLSISPSFNITGGEPFIREDIFDLIGEIRGRGYGVAVLTNGTMIDRERAGRLASAGVRTVQVSIEGGEAVHDRIRGRGSHAASLHGIKNLVDAGLAVTMNTTLSRMNADGFMEMAETASSLGVRRVGFSRLVPWGRGRDMLGSALSTDEVRALYEKIYEKIHEKKSGEGIDGVEIVTGDPVAAQMGLPVPVERTSGGDTPLGGCAAGVSGITVMPDGTVLPCRRLDVPVGNVRTDSLRELWATSDVFNRLRERGRYKGKCKKCARWETCRGCRAVAYAFTGDFLAEDPQCFLDR